MHDGSVLKFTDMGVTVSRLGVIQLHPVGEQVGAAPLMQLAILTKVHSKAQRNAQLQQNGTLKWTSATAAVGAGKGHICTAN